MKLALEMEKYLKELGRTDFPKPPREALFSAAGGEIFGPEIHLAFNAAPYLLIGKRIKNMPEPPGRILDLGCGTGYGTHYLKEHFAPAASIFGLDRVPALLEYASENYSRSGLQFINGDASTLPFPGESFDLVIAVFSIVHTMTRSQSRNCLLEIGRILKPGGILIFTTPNRNLSQNLYHENPGNEPDLFFCHLIRTEFRSDELRSFLLSFCGGEKKPFNTVSIGTLSNTALFPAWKNTLAKLRKKRFPGAGKESLISILARRFLPSGFKARYFFRMVKAECRRMGISSVDIARGVRYYPEGGRKEGEHFVVMMEKDPG